MPSNPHPQISTSGIAMSRNTLHLPHTLKVLTPNISKCRIAILSMQTVAILDNAL